MKEYIVEVAVKGTMQYTVKAKNKKEAIKKACDRSSPIDNCYFGDAIHHLWSTAKAY